MTTQLLPGKIVRKATIIRCGDYNYIFADPSKSIKIVEAESLKEGIISAVKLTKVPPEELICILNDRFFITEGA